MADSIDTDQTAPWEHKQSDLGLHCLSRGSGFSTYITLNLVCVFQAMSATTNIITQDCFPKEELNSKKRPDTVSYMHFFFCNMLKPYTLSF